MHCVSSALEKLHAEKIRIADHSPEATVSRRVLEALIGERIRKLD